MSHGTNLIYAPVTMPADIAAVLGIAGTNLQQICQSQNINKWAKWKPIAYNKVEQLTDSERYYANYGIVDIPTWGNINKMANFWLGIDTSSTNAPDCGIRPDYWGYQRPSSYFRLSDFSNYAKTQGYLHSAEAPIGGTRYSSYTIDSSGNLRINYYSSSNSDSQVIHLGDLVYPRNLSQGIGNMYFGVLLYNLSTGTKYAVTQTTRISELSTYGAYVDISGLTQAFNGNYKIFPFASSDYIAFTSNLAQYTNGDFVALYEAETIAIGSTVTRIDILTLNAYRDLSSSNRYLYQNINLVNNNSIIVTVTIVYEVKNSSDQTIQTITRTGIQINSNDSRLYSEALLMDSTSVLNAAYAVRATVTPTNGANPVSTAEVCLVTDGPSPYA